MLSTKQLMFASFVFMVGTLSCLIIEGAYYGQGDLDIINALTGYNVIQMSGAGIWAIPKLGLGFMTTGLPKLLLWDFSFFEGGWFIFRLFLIGTLSLALVWGVTMALISFGQGILNQFIGK